MCPHVDDILLPNMDNKIICKIKSLRICVLSGDVWRADAVPQKQSLLYQLICIAADAILL